MNKKLIGCLAVFCFVAFGLPNKAGASELTIGDKAPTFTARTQDNKPFDLSSRRDKWTVLYFYPKADTPGCTKQACAFRDSIKKIRELNADVFGVSTDTVAEIVAFHKKHRLNFDLLADPDKTVVENYGTARPIIGISKRWTFLIDPELKIRLIDHDVDPVKDADKMAEALKKLQSHNK